jgi:hypothetical protein
LMVRGRRFIIGGWSVSGWVIGRWSVSGWVIGGWSVRGRVLSVTVNSDSWSVNKDTLIITGIAVVVVGTVSV